MFFDLSTEFFGVGERSERVSVCSGEELHLACVGKFAQHINKFGHILFELLEGNAGYGDSATEFALGFFNHTQQGLGCGDITLVSDAAHDVLVEEEVVVVMVVTDIKEAVAFQTVWLMYFEIETN